MSREITHKAVLDFFEEIPKYYGCLTEITVGLVDNIEEVNAQFSTWNLSEFELIRSAYRSNGGRFMMEGQKLYYEIAADKIVLFKQTGRNKFECVEKYSEVVYRITKIRFHYNY